MELAGVIITAVVTLAALWLKWYTERDKTYEDLQVGRRDIESGNTAAVDERVDRLLVGQDGNTSGLPSSEDAARRLSEL